MQNSLNAAKASDTIFDHIRRTQADPWYAGDARREAATLGSIAELPRHVNLGEVTRAMIDTENFSPRGMAEFFGLGPDFTNPWYQPLNDPALSTIPEEEHWRFVEYDSPHALRQAVSSYHVEAPARAIIEDASTSQALAGGLGGALLDPLTWAELAVTGGTVKAARTAGSGVVRAAGAGFAAGASAGAVEQSIVEASLSEDVLRTREEAALSIAASTLFGGILGGAGGLVSQVRVNKAAQEMIGQAASSPQMMALGFAAQVAEVAQKRGLDIDLDGDKIVQIVVDEVLEGKGGDFVTNLKVSPLGILPGSKKLRDSMKLLSPGMRLAMSESGEARTYLHQISNLPFERVNLPDELAGASALETVSKRWEGRIAGVLLDHSKAYAGSGRGLRMEEFGRLVSEALSRGDKIDLDTARSIVPNATQLDIDAVADLAPKYRAAYDEIADLAIRTGALDDLDGLGNTAASYRPRKYDRAAIDVRREEFRELLREYHGKGEGRTLSEQKIDDAINAIMGLDNDGLDINIAASNPLAARTIMVPDDFSITRADGSVLRFSDFLVNDPEAVLQSHALSVVPKLLHSERFSSGAGSQASAQLLDAMKKVGKAVNELAEGDHEGLLKVGRAIDDMILAAHDQRVLAGLNMNRRKHGKLIEGYTQKSSLRRKIRTQISELTEQMDEAHRIIEGAVEKRGPKSVIEDAEGVIERGTAKMRKLRKIDEATTSQLNDIAKVAQQFDDDIKVVSPKSKAATDIDSMRARYEEATTSVASARRAIYQQGAGTQRFKNAIDQEVDDAITAGDLTEAQAGKMRKKAEKMKEDIDIVHRRFLNLPSIGERPESLLTRGSKILRTFSTLTKMGGVALSSVPDIALGIMVHGFMPYARAMMAQIRQFKDLLPKFSVGRGSLKRGFKTEFQDDMARAVYGFEMAMGATRMERMAGFSDYRNAGTGKVERGTAWARRGFGQISGIQWWNSRMRIWSATQAQERLIRSVELYKAGKLSDRDLARLRTNRVTESDLNRWSRQLDKWADEDDLGDGIKYKWGNSEKWSDNGARLKWEETILHFSNQSLIDVGVADLPGSMDSQLGALILQFKSFAIASTQRTAFAGLQRADREVLQGMVGLFVMGGIAHMLKEAIAGRDVTEEGEAEFVLNAIDRSGMLGVVTDANAILERWSHGKLGLSPAFGSEGVKRYSDRGGVDAVVGPNLGMVEQIMSAGRVAAEFRTGGDIDPKDISTLRRVIPYQNLFYLRWLFDRTEGALQEAVR